MATPEQIAGKKQERVVAALERHMSPHSKIDVDVKLPVLKAGVSGLRQFDVVVHEGKPPRQTLTVVEVQKRKTKVGPDQFNAWHTKMTEVGAQHLICVSERDYTKSVIERAREIGPTVRLLTLKSIEKNGVSTSPDFFASWLQSVTYLEAQQIEIQFRNIIGATERLVDENAIDPKKTVLVTSEGNELSFNDLADWHFFGSGDKYLSQLPSNKEICPSSEFFGERGGFCNGGSGSVSV